MGCQGGATKDATPPELRTTRRQSQSLVDEAFLPFIVALLGTQVLGYLYSSTGYQDELAYAAAMLYKVTGEPNWAAPCLLVWVAVRHTAQARDAACACGHAVSGRRCLAHAVPCAGLPAAAARSALRAPGKPTFPHYAAGEDKYKADAAKYFAAVPGTPLTQEVGELKPLTAVVMAQVGAFWIGADQAWLLLGVRGTVRAGGWRAQAADRCRDGAGVLGRAALCSRAGRTHVGWEPGRTGSHACSFAPCARISPSLSHSS